MPAAAAALALSAALGMLADIVVLSEDILALPQERLLEAKVLLTIMDGQDTFRAPELQAR